MNMLPVVEPTQTDKPSQQQQQQIVPKPIYHELEYPWTFSFKPRIAYKQQSERDWLSDYKTIYIIKDIERFWCVYNNIPCITDMPHGSIYSVFRNGIHPSWEHADNRQGFSWVLYGCKNTSKEYTRNLYESSLLALISCSYMYESFLNGCTFEKKTKGDKFVYWFNGNPKDGDASKLREDMLVQLLTIMNIKTQDYFMCDDMTKIDWKLPEFKSKKICIKLVHHNESVSTKGVKGKEK